MLELAILGLLNEAPVDGTSCGTSSGLRLGGLRVFSYGSLYPALRGLLRAGLIVEDTRRHRIRSLVPAGPVGLPDHRRGQGAAVRAALDSGPQAWDDDGFGVHLGFFSRTRRDPDALLEGRRRAVEERRGRPAHRTGQGRRAIDRYTRELHQLGWTPVSGRCAGSTS